MKYFNYYVWFITTNPVHKESMQRLWTPIYQEGRIWISLTGLAPPPCCACPTTWCIMVCCSM